MILVDGFIEIFVYELSVDGGLFDFFLVIMGYGLFDFFCVLGLGWQVVQYWADGHALT